MTTTAAEIDPSSSALGAISLRRGIRRLGNRDRDRRSRQRLYRVPFGRSVDVGLGATSSTYMDILIQTLPSDLTLEELWPAPRRLNQAEHLYELPAYRHALERRIAMGESETGARCGVITVAGRAVGASFVGVAAAALAVGDLLRALHSGRDYLVVELDLRNPRPSEGQPKAGLGLPPRYGMHRSLGAPRRPAPRPWYRHPARHRLRHRRGQCVQSQLPSSGRGNRSSGRLVRWGAGKLSDQE